MKKLILMMFSGLLAAACEKPVLCDVEDESETPGMVEGQKRIKKFTFTVKGDFGAATFTRATGYLSADGADMTDLWVFDYVDGACVQSMHQTSGDEAWGKPQMSLAYGSHHVYFVASRGDEPALDTDDHVITWGSPRDAFWKDYVVEVVNTSNGNRAVTLDRVATKLKLTVMDDVPDGCTSVTVTPEKWFYGLDYMAGTAVSQQRKDRDVSVPASYIGTAGQLAVSIFGLSGADEWITNVTVTAKNADGGVLGTASIVGAPFKRNRATEYSGSLFGSAGSMDVSLNVDWENPKTGTW